jgi:hypothetical protein
MEAMMFKGLGVTELNHLHNHWRKGSAYEQILKSKNRSIWTFRDTGIVTQADFLCLSTSWNETLDYDGDRMVFFIFLLKVTEKDGRLVSTPSYSATSISYDTLEEATKAFDEVKK